jgi:hypothetical protein
MPRLRNPNLVKAKREERLKGFVLKSPNEQYLSKEGKLTTLDKAEHFGAVLTALKAAKEHGYPTGYFNAIHITK